MAKLRLLKFVQIVIGWRNSGMETHYQKKPREEILVDARPNIDYKKELTRQDKENIFKEIYSNIDMFKKLIGKATKYNDSGRNS